MIYLKSALAGIAAILLVILLIVVGIVVVGLTSPPVAHDAVGWDPMSLMHWRFWGAAAVLLIFLVGFVWEFRRCLRK